LSNNYNTTQSIAIAYLLQPFRTGFIPVKDMAGGGQGERGGKELERIKGKEGGQGSLQQSYPGDY